jgi:hypothetical protein
MNISEIWLPMVNTGFNDVIGSWKIMAIRLPRIRRICCGDKSNRFIPSKWMRPSTILPGGSGISCITDWAVTLFPAAGFADNTQHLAGFQMVKDTPSTARAPPLQKSKNRF